jgi:hypothetical protein
MRTLNLSALSSLCILSVVACGGSASQPEPAAPPADPGPADYVKDDNGKEDSSFLATVLDFEFDGELVSDHVSSYNTREVIQDQLLFTIGHLNANQAVGRLDRVDVTNTQTSATGDGKTRLSYHAKMPVAWGSKTNLPTSYTFTLPKDVSYQGQEDFTKKYKDACVDYHAHDVTSGSMWYYYRPERSGCRLAEADVLKLPVKVTVSNVNTTGKYPEYHKVWEDKALNVVSVFGKYEDGATSAGDAGISAYNEFVSAVRTALSGYNPTTVPASVPSSPGVGTPDVEFKATLEGGRTVQINALLVDNVANAGTTFYDRYEGLSTRADLIAYNGHAGLGQNVRALAKKGKWVAGQYVIVFMNGCDTFAYVDGSLAQTRAAVNPEDPTGTRFMEIVTNAMPAFFASDAEATMAIVNGLLKVEAPLTYEKIFQSIDRSQIVLVTGEQDNEYFPGYDPTGGTTPPPDPVWGGIDESGTVTKGQEKRWETPALAAGAYVVQTSGSGDADLYVRVGKAPTATAYDCRPYRSGTKETCKVNLTTTAAVHVMVRGYASSSSFRLVAKKQ